MAKHFPRDAREQRYAVRVGKAVRRWRERTAKTTREQLAPKMGVSVRTLERIESGKADVRMSLLGSMERECSGVVKSVFRVFSTEIG